MSKTIPLSLFSIANNLYRDHKYEEAWGIYELLNELNPTFPYYSHNLNEAKKKFSLITGQEAKKFHFEKATEITKRLRIADYLSLYGNMSFVETCFDNSPTNSEHWLVRANVAAAQKNYDLWLECVNRYLSENKIAPISLAYQYLEKDKGIFPYLRPANHVNSIEDDSLVSICMSCFNAEDYVENAVRSLLNQSYKNIELFLINDKSEDNTLEILQKLSREDSRIILINNKDNVGTYVSRNKAFSQAKGEFFTVMDADDFALTDRIEFQVKYLKENPEKKGVLHRWVRSDINGRFSFRTGWGGSYLHEAVATLMVRREVRDKVGYWDSVRFSADSEYFLRLQKVYGKHAIKLLDRLNTLSLFHENSLTNHPVTGFTGNNGISPIRSAYKKSWEEWHANTNKDSLYIPFPQVNRLFDAPVEMMSQ